MAGKSKKDKVTKEASPEEQGEHIKMIWLHKRVEKGSLENVFGMPGVANEDGFLVVDCPTEKVKNEMKRKPNSLVSLEYHLEKEKMKAQFEAKYSD